MDLTAIADDLTGACDVGAELAAAGHRVRVVVAPDGAATSADDAVTIVNTQSRALPASEARARVHAALQARPADVVLKKIDTALRGHLGAEIDAVAAPVFVLAAIPSAGRVTRDGCQWFGGRPLAATEFARDPEGAGPESSIAKVVARESERRVAVLGCELIGAGRLADAVARGRRDGVDVFVVDAETDADVASAVAAILALPRPVCLAGSIALAAALARHRDPGSGAPTATAERVPLPALIVNGSLHSRAREQTDAVVAAGLAVAMPLPSEDGADVAERVATAASVALAAGSSVVVTPAPPTVVPAGAALRATERRLTDVVGAIAARTTIGSLVLIGGETSYAILTALAADTLAISGRVAPLIAYGMIMAGALAGTVVVTKGGSGGAPDALARLLGSALDSSPRTARARA